MRRLGLHVGGVLAGLSLSDPAVSQTSKQVDDWWRGQIEASHGLPHLGERGLRWRLELVYAPAPEELASLRQQLSQHPEHPDRQLLAAYERRATGKPDVSAQTLWSNGREWRLCEDRTLGSDSSLVDTTIASGVAWRLSPDQLTVVDPTGGWPREADFRPVASELGNDVPLLLFGGAHLAHQMGMRFDAPVVESSSWRIRGIGREERVTIEVTGAWDLAADRGLVQLVRVVACPDVPSEVGRSWGIEQWRHDEQLGRWVAGIVTETRPDGRIERRLVYESTIAAPAPLEAILAVPQFDRPDAIRGKLTFTSVRDFRSDEPEMIIRTEQGLIRGPDPAALATRESNRLRVLGWIAVGGIVAVLVGIRMRKR